MYIKTIMTTNNNIEVESVMFDDVNCLPDSNNEVFCIFNNNNNTPIKSDNINKTPTNNECNEAYKKISNYPIPSQPIRYPKKIDPNTNEYNFNAKSTFHDLIHTNMQELIPNIDLGLYNKHSYNDIEEWINKTKDYINKLNDNIQNSCNERIKSLKFIKKQKELSKKLDMNNVNNLPDEIINHIHGYLLPETRIKLLLSKYEDYLIQLEKITSRNLKQYLRNIQKVYIKNIFNYDSKSPERHTCISKIPEFNVSFSKKEVGIKQLKRLLKIIRNAIPKTREFNYYYQSNALKLLQSMIYIGIYNGNKLKRNKNVLLNHNNI